MHNKKSSLTLLAMVFGCSMFSLATFASAQTTYNIEPVSLGQGYEIAGGFITTDGTIGNLVTGNIIDYEVIVTGAVPYVFTPSNPGANVVIGHNGGVVTASATEIFLPLDVDTGNLHNQFTFEATDNTVATFGFQQVRWTNTLNQPGAFSGSAVEYSYFDFADFDPGVNVLLTSQPQFIQAIATISPSGPPTANAGDDFSVNEGQQVTLDGSLSFDPDGDPLFYEWTQVSGSPVELLGASTQHPSFTAPEVPIGGDTLSFELTVTANDESATDTVSVTVVNVNHTPVADAGDDQSIAEGSLVTLHGEDSFDIDIDPISYAWVQVGGSPTVTLTSSDTANPTFTAPFVSAGGAPGVVATLVFELTVDDGFPQDATAPGYTFANVVDSLTVEITNLNNFPTAAAGGDQTVDENTPVTLSGAASSDPDSDPLTYAWAQVGGPAVVDLIGELTVMPSFTVDFVSPGGTDIEFKLTVNDGFGGSATDTVVIHVQNANDPPLVSAAQPSTAVLWPPNHRLVSVNITGVSDPDNNATITIDSVSQDELTVGQGDGDTAVDAVINADGTVLLRAERSGNGNGRVYHIHFTASDLEGSASGMVTVSVPHRKKGVAIDDGELYDSTY